MSEKLKNILLIDDDSAVNFIHNHVINKANIAEQVITKTDEKKPLII